MAAGDLALAMLITATDLASVVVADMATSYIGNTVAMTDSTVLLDDAVVTAAASLDLFSVSADGTAIAVVSVADEAAVLSAYLADAGVSADVIAASLDMVAASADAAGVSLLAPPPPLAAIATNGAAAAASLDAAGVSADAASGGFDILAVSEDAASAGLSALAAVAGAVVLALAAVVVVLTGIGVVSTKMAGDFQQNITKLYTTAGEAKNNLQMVGDGILNMASSVGTGALQLSQSMYWIESGGLHGAAALEALRVAAQAAKAENADLDKVSIALAASLNAYAGSGMTDIQVMNTLTAATGQGMMTFEQLSGSLASVLPAAAKFGVSLGDVTAALATMTAQGDPAEQAATHLKQVLLALEAPSKIGAAALKSVGLTSTEVAKEMRINLPDALKMITDAVGKKFPEGSAAYNQAIKNIAGGSKQMMGFLELTGSHMDTFAANVDKISGAVKKGGNDLMGWADVQQNFNFQIDAAKAALGALFITIGQQLLPVITPLVKNVADGVTAFGAWLTKTGALQSAMSGLSGFLGGIGDAFNHVNDKVAPFKETIAHFATAYGDVLNKIEGTATAIAPLKDAFGQTMNNLTQLGNTVKPVTTNFGGLLNTLEQSGQKVTPLADSFDRATGLIKGTTGAITQAKTPWQTFLQAVKDGATFIHNIDWGSIGHALQNMGTAIKNVDWGSVWAALKNVGVALGQMGTAIKNVNWAAVWTAMQNIGTAISTVATALSKVDWGGIFATIGGAIKNVSTTLSKVDWGKVFSTVGTALQGIGNFLKSTFMPVWDQLVQSFKDIQAALKPVMPQLQQFGQSLAIGVGLAIILVISILAGLISAFANVLTGVAIFVTGVVQFFSGLYQFFTSVMQLISDLLSGHWERIASDLSGIMNGIVNMFLGAWNMIKGLWVAAGGFIFAFADGFSKAIVGIFQGLWDTLVGHSIIPDMVNGIINWFLQLGPRGLAAINILITDAKNALMNFASQAVQLGSNIVQGIANGIAGAFGFIGTQMSRLTSFIGSFLPHSPAEQGELSHLNEYGPSFVKGFADGITRSHPMMHTALSGLTSIMAAPGSFAAGSASGGNAFALSGGQTIVVQVQPQKQDIYLDRKKVGEGVMQYAQQEIRISGNVRR